VTGEALKNTLLRLLADGDFHSGSELAGVLGVSRTAVWKAVRELEALGLTIAALPGRGYRVTSPLELLDEAAIRSGLTPEAAAWLAGLDLRDRLDSTNGHLLRAAGRGAPAGTVCLAETQTAGRGRIGRSWVSPFGANLYLSLLWRFEDPAQVAGLSLAVGVATVRALKRAGVAGIGLKWPNDLLWEDRKLGGILLEATGEAHGSLAVVVGLGLNRYLPAAAARDIDQAWADLSQIPDTPLPPRNTLIALLLNELLPLLGDYARRGLRPWLSEWRAHHRLEGREVILHQGEARIRGRIADISPEGLLILRGEDGCLREFASGDVRLRAAGD
jgi:BirA family biotin operon repressor/biotin-[acetyl-CoA-carboxylase] ligase